MKTSSIPSQSKHQEIEILGKVSVVEDRVLLPFYQDYVSAGFPSPASDYKIEQIDLNQILIQNPNATYLARCGGSSMLGKRIDVGDILVVDRSIEATSGKIVIASVNGEFTLKELCLDNQTPILKAHHPDYQHITLKQGDELEIFGVVTASIVEH